MKIKFKGTLTHARIAKEIDIELGKHLKLSRGKLISCCLYYTIKDEFGNPYDYIDVEIDLTNGGNKRKPM